MPVKTKIVVTVSVERYASKNKRYASRTGYWAFMTERPIGEHWKFFEVFDTTYAAAKVLAEKWAYKVARENKLSAVKLIVQ